MTNQERNREIGRRIRNLRRDQGWTQVGLAKKMHLGTHSIIDIEHGQRRVTLDEAVDFARVLDVEITYLAGTTNGYRKVGTQ